MPWNDEMFGAMLERVGMKGISGKIYAHLITSFRPLTMKEIARRTGYSLSSISTNLNTLVRLRLVEKVKNGSVYVYHAVKDTIQLYRDQVRLIVESEIIPLQKRLTSAMTSERDPAMKEEICKMLDEITTFREYLESHLTRHVPKRRGSPA